MKYFWPMQVEICRHLIVGGKFYGVHVSNLHLCAKRTGNSWYKYWALRWKDVFHASQSGVQIPWKYKTQHHHLDVYQRSLSAIHLHAAVHNCGRGQSNWGLRSCLKYFVFCRLLYLWFFFFCLVDRCLVVVWCYCCVPFSEEEKNNSCFVVIQNFAFLTLCWQLWVCPASPSCNATISFPARQPWASFFPLDFRRNAQNRFPSKKCIRFPTQGRSQLNFLRGRGRSRDQHLSQLRSCHHAALVVVLFVCLLFLLSFSLNSTSF